MVSRRGTTNVIHDNAHWDKYAWEQLIRPLSSEDGLLAAVRELRQACERLSALVEQQQPQRQYPQPSDPIEAHCVRCGDYARTWLMAERERLCGACVSYWAMV